MRPRTDEKRVHNAQFLSWGGASIASSPRGLIGLIAPSFSGTHGLPCSPQVCPSPRSQQRATKVSRTLAPLDTNHFNVYLGVETNFWSPGMSPVTLAPRVVITLFFTLIFYLFSQPCHPHTRSSLSLYPCYLCFPPCFHAIYLLSD